jgi:hypothetical protein
MVRMLTLCIMLGVLWVPCAVADTMYSYTGDTFHTVSGVYLTSDRITGSFTVRDGFIPGKSTLGAVFTGVGFVDGVVAYSFSDGHQVLTKENSTAAIALGVPIVNGEYPVDANWPEGFQPRELQVQIFRSSSEPSIFLYREFGSRVERAVLDATNRASNHAGCFPICDGSRPGTWRVETVPEPPTWLLTGLGLMLLLPAVLTRGGHRGRTFAGSIGTCV